MSLLRDSSVLQLSALARAAAGLGATLLLTQLLGATEQGRYYVAVALFSLLYLVFGTGAHAVTVTRLAAAASAGDAESARRWMGFHLLAQSGVALALGSFGLLWPWLAPSLAGADGDIGLWAAALCWTPLLELPRSLASAQLQALRRMVPLVGLEASAELIRAFLIVAGALTTGSPAGAVAGWLVASACSIPLAVSTVTREHRAGTALFGWREILRGARHAPLVPGLRQGLGIGLTRNVGLLTREVLPALVVQRVATSAWVAYLRIAQRVAATALSLSSGVSRTALPALGAAVGDARRFARMWSRATLLSGAIVGLAWIAALLLLPWVLRGFSPAEYHAPVVAIAWALTPGLLVAGFATCSEAFHVATHTIRVALVFTGLGIPLAVACVLVGASIDPYLGVAWGISIATAGLAVHPLYAVWWIRRRSRAARLTSSGAVPRTAPPLRG